MNRRFERGVFKPSLMLLMCTACLLIAGCTGANLPSFTPTFQPVAAQVVPVSSSATTALALPSLTPSYTASPSPSSTHSLAPTSTSTSSPPFIFAVIGDYGEGNQAEADVANLVKSWKPELIITTGDNNYPNGEAATIDARIGQYYHEYIYPYKGSYGAGSDTNRFFPSLGNHDWIAAGAKPYLEYFSLPGNGRYYDFTFDNVHFFALDSDDQEPDGVGVSSKQANWLKTGLAAAQEPWKIVYFHHPPYSSGTHGSTDWMRWPFQQWGATAVLSGHDHTYERLLVNGFAYFVNGLGGGPRYSFEHDEAGSQARYNEDYGAMRVEVNPSQMIFQFINRAGNVIDSYTIPHA